MARSCNTCGDLIDPEFSDWATVCDSCYSKHAANDAIRAEKAAKPKRHTYINTLQEDVIARDARIVELEEQIESIVTYLSLDKFAPPSNSWVSKYDILRMLGRY